ncbi:MAG: TlpA family protein disulfide reductase [Planctomycetes bacterium]|nr:TlpA family protein disulfide reductase [Planctomycetota bacterium]
MLQAPLRLFRVHSIALLALAVVAALLPVSHAAAQGTVVDAIEAPGAEATIEGVPEVPPLPEGGTPAELLAFIAELKQKNFKPRSREEMMGYVRSVAVVSTEAANRILKMVKPTDTSYGEAAKLKLESLMMLGRLGDEKAADEMGTFAATLVDCPDEDLAKEARRLVIVADAQQLFSPSKAGTPPAAAEVSQKAAALVKKITMTLQADPSDSLTAGLAMQVANALEHLPGAENAASDAYASFIPVFSQSDNPQVKGMSENFAGILRRLKLPGQPMEINGTLLSGDKFDQKTLAGKVVLVDFWATWCGPCVQELPNVQEQYTKYHAKGFEVVGVSLDEDRAALEKFVADNKLPWPILFEKSEGEGWKHPLATYYGISGIPTVILIGRDGKVVSLDARGEKLGEQLDKLFGAGG